MRYGISDPFRSWQNTLVTLMNDAGIPELLLKYEAGVPPPPPHPPVGRQGCDTTAHADEYLGTNRT